MIYFQAWLGCAIADIFVNSLQDGFVYFDLFDTGLGQLNFADVKSFANNFQCLCSYLALAPLLAGLMLLPAHRGKWCYLTAALYNHEVTGVARF